MFYSSYTTTAANDVNIISFHLFIWWLDILVPETLIPYHSGYYKPSLSHQPSFFSFPLSPADNKRNC